MYEINLKISEYQKTFSGTAEVVVVDYTTSGDIIYDILRELDEVADLDYLTGYFTVSISISEIYEDKNLTNLLVSVEDVIHLDDYKSIFELSPLLANLEFNGSPAVFKTELVVMYAGKDSIVLEEEGVDLISTVEKISEREELKGLNEDLDIKITVYKVMNRSLESSSFGLMASKEYTVEFRSNRKLEDNDEILEDVLKLMIDGSSAWSEVEDEDYSYLD